MIESLAFAVMAAAGPQDVPDSQYRGYHYEQRWEPVRKCIVWRESRNRKSADGRNGSGLYQFIQTTWDSFITDAGFPEWKGVRPYKAPRYVQDAMFWFVINPKPKLKGLHGAHHWGTHHATGRITNCYER
jgi:hypothetical protein